MEYGKIETGDEQATQVTEGPRTERVQEITTAGRFRRGDVIRRSTQVPARVARRDEQIAKSPLLHGVEHGGGQPN